MKRPGVQDLALGLVLAVVNVVSLLPYRKDLHPFWLALVLVTAQALPLIVRRRFPVPVMAIIGSVRVGYDVYGFSFAPFPLATAIALYTVFDRSCWLWRWVVGVLTGVGLGISLSTPGHDEPYEAIYQGLIFVTAAAAAVTNMRP
jgi:hypothetical protein